MRPLFTYVTIRRLNIPYIQTIDHHPKISHKYRCFNVSKIDENMEDKIKKKIPLSRCIFFIAQEQQSTKGGEGCYSTHINGSSKPFHLCKLLSLSSLSSMSYISLYWFGVCWLFACVCIIMPSGTGEGEGLCRFSFVLLWPKPHAEVVGMEYKGMSSIYWFYWFSQRGAIESHRQRDDVTRLYKSYVHIGRLASQSGFEPLWHNLVPANTIHPPPIATLLGGKSEWWRKVRRSFCVGDGVMVRFVVTHWLMELRLLSETHWATVICGVRLKWLYRI